MNRQATLHDCGLVHLLSVYVTTVKKIYIFELQKILPKIYFSRHIKLKKSRAKVFAINFGVPISFSVNITKGRLLDKAKLQKVRLSL